MHSLVGKKVVVEIEAEDARRLMLDLEEGATRRIENRSSGNISSKSKGGLAAMQSAVLDARRNPGESDLQELEESARSLRLWKALNAGMAASENYGYRKITIDVPAWLHESMTTLFDQGALSRADGLGSACRINTDFLLAQIFHPFTAFVSCRRLELRQIGTTADKLPRLEFIETDKQSISECGPRQREFAPRPAAQWSMMDTQLWLASNPLPASFRWRKYDGTLASPKPAVGVASYGLWLRNSVDFPDLFNLVHRLLRSLGDRLPADGAHLADLLTA